MSWLCHCDHVSGDSYTRNSLDTSCVSCNSAQFSHCLLENSIRVLRLKFCKTALPHHPPPWTLVFAWLWQISQSKHVLWSPLNFRWELKVVPLLQVRVIGWRASQNTKMHYYTYVIRDPGQHQNGGDVPSNVERASLFSRLAVLFSLETPQTPYEWHVYGGAKISNTVLRDQRINTRIRHLPCKWLNPCSIPGSNHRVASEEWSRMILKHSARSQPWAQPLLPEPTKQN